MLDVGIRILTFVLVQSIHTPWKEQARASDVGTEKEFLEARSRSGGYHGKSGKFLIHYPNFNPI